MGRLSSGEIGGILLGTKLNRERSRSGVRDVHISISFLSNASMLAGFHDLRNRLAFHAQDSVFRRWAVDAYVFGHTISSRAYSVPFIRKKVARASPVLLLLAVARRWHFR